MTDASPNTPALFDPSALKKRVAEAVQSTFGSLIPDEAFKGMVDKEIRDFFETPTVSVVTKPTNDSYGRTTYTTEVNEKITPFAQMVRAAFVERVRSGLDKAFNAEEFQAKYHYTTGNNASEFAKAMMKELAPQMAAALFAGIIDEVMMRMRNELTRR